MPGIESSGPFWTPGANLSNAIATLGPAGGTVIIPPGTWVWESVPALPKNITGLLRIIGDGATIVLTAAAPRFLDFNRTADHDTFQNFDISDFLIDCNNIDVATHTIIGSRNNVGTSDMRVNIQNVAVRRIRVMNIPTSATNRSGISLQTRQAAGGEGTQNYIKNVLIEDVTLEGGLTGFMVTGGPAGAITNVNTLIDNVRINRCSHLQPSQTVPAGSTGACVQIGQNAPVGYVLVRDVYGEYSPDVGIEIDNAVYAEVENCQVVNCKSGYLTTNFATPPIPNAQSVVYRHCKAKLTDATVALATKGWVVNPNNSLAIGNITYDGCVFEHNNNRFGASATQAPIVFSFADASVTNRASIRGCRVNIENINWNNAASSEPARVIGIGAATINRLEVRGLDVRINGQISGAGNFLSRVVAIDQGGGNAQLDIDGMDIDVNVTGMGAAGATYGFFVVPSGACTVGGTIRGVRFVNLGSDTTSKGLRFGSTTNLTIGPKAIAVQGCDFANIGGTEFQLDATQAALGAIITRGNRWKTKPVPVALTGLVTGTGKRLGAQAASVVWQSHVQFLQGSGAAITAIDYSTDDGGTYTNLVTQASAALPGGTGPKIGPLNPADLIKVTFTTTQPTTTLVPVDP
jgi:hypothetical protein